MLTPELHHHIQQAFQVFQHAQKTLIQWTFYEQGRHGEPWKQEPTPWLDHLIQAGVPLDAVFMDYPYWWTAVADKTCWQRLQERGELDEWIQNLRTKFRQDHSKTIPWTRWMENPHFFDVMGFLWQNTTAETFPELWAGLQSVHADPSAPIPWVTALHYGDVPFSQVKHRHQPTLLFASLYSWEGTERLIEALQQHDMRIHPRLLQEQQRIAGERLLTAEPLHVFQTPQQMKKWQQWSVAGWVPPLSPERQWHIALANLITHQPVQQTPNKTFKLWTSYTKEIAKKPLSIDPDALKKIVQLFDEYCTTIEPHPVWKTLLDGIKRFHGTAISPPLWKDWKHEDILLLFLFSQDPQFVERGDWTQAKPWTWVFSNSTNTGRRAKMMDDIYDSTFGPKWWETCQQLLTSVHWKPLPSTPTAWEQAEEKMNQSDNNASNNMELKKNMLRFLAQFPTAFQREDGTCLLNETKKKFGKSRPKWTGLWYQAEFEQLILSMGTHGNTISSKMRL